MMMVDLNEVLIHAARKSRLVL